MSSSYPDQNGEPCDSRDVELMYCGGYGPCAWYGYTAYARVLRNHHGDRARSIAIFICASELDLISDKSLGTSMVLPCYNCTDPIFRAMW